MSRLLAGAIAVGLAAIAGVAYAGGARRPIREVVGGVPAPEGKFPWVVRLSMGCGGALTAPRVVLTAGHCVDGTGDTEKIEVVAGAVDLKSPKAQSAHSVRVYRAPGFRDETRGDDWAVIRLDHPLNLPVLPLSGTDADKGEFVVMGWGQTREDSLKQEQRLHYATVPTVSDDECAKEYKRAGVRLVADESICAGTKTVDTCQGDSGGPMVGRDAHGGWVQIGIVSWGLGCARDGYPGVYTQIATFRDEIRKAVARLS
ncbi:serine protease [Paractinoplanes ferrugineus]|uniref:Trypsin n=1 Tax=Paractinoplanes ferrugineus TaxID=113564 RepID=A0A919IWK8_9ACTN|nr:trypsin [Actinoplanes ferrugineus]